MTAVCTKPQVSQFEPKHVAVNKFVELVLCVTYLIHLLMVCNTDGVVSPCNNRLMLFRGITALFRIMAKPMNTPGAQNAVGTYSNHFA